MDIVNNSGVVAPDVDASAYPTTSPAKAASVILRCIENGDLYAFPGKDARIAKLLSRIAPKQTLNLVQSRMKVLMDKAAPKRLSATRHGDPSAP